MSRMLLTEAIRQKIVTVRDVDKEIFTGDYVNYEPEKGKCELTTAQTGTKENQFFTTEKLYWRLEKICGQVLLVAEEATEQELELKGKRGYENGIEAMDNLAKGLYSSPLAENVTVVTGKMQKDISSCHREHWLGSLCVRTGTGGDYFGLSFVYDSGVNGYILYGSNGYCGYYSFGVRPVILLKSNVQVEILDGEFGSKERPWHILLEKDEELMRNPSRKFSKIEWEQLFKEGSQLVKQTEGWLAKVEKALKAME